MSGEQSQGSGAQQGGSGSSASFKGDAPFTASEKAYTNQQLGGEYQLTQQHGLKRGDSGDRAEGRAIARAYQDYDSRSK